MTSPSPFENDIAAQPAALRALAESDALTALSVPHVSGFDRVILTGMGASHYSVIPTWQRLVNCGYPAWWLSTSELLESPALVTRESLLLITSQSGRSGEIVALLEAIEESPPEVHRGSHERPHKSVVRDERRGRGPAIWERGHGQFEELPELSRSSPGAL